MQQEHCARREHPNNQHHVDSDASYTSSSSASSICGDDAEMLPFLVRHVIILLEAQKYTQDVVRVTHTNLESLFVVPPLALL